MSPFFLLLAVSPPDEPLELIDQPEHAIPIDGGVMPTQDLADEPRRRALGAKILYVNFDGGQMNGFCGDDPHDNCSSIFNGVVLPYSGDAVKRASVIQVIRSRVEDFGITVTDTRPAAGDYDMEMVGNWQGEQPGFAGVAPNIDCFDNDGGETSFTLESAQTADGIAEIVLQEAAHTWGLEHVDEGTDLLYPTTSGSNKTFVDECYKIVSDTMLNPSNGYCNNVHTQFCNSGWQNSHAELLLVFGESVPDSIAPTVEILEPSDGATLEGDVDLVVSFADDQTPVVINATITISGDALAEPVEATGAYAGPSELSFPIDGLPEGEYTITVDALDESDNPASDQISITIDNPVAADESGDDAASADSAGTGDGGDADTGDGGENADADAGDDDGDDGSGGSEGPSEDDSSADRGCACDVPTSRGPLAAFGLTLLAFVGVRRRTR